MVFLTALGQRVGEQLLQEVAAVHPGHHPGALLDELAPELEVLAEIVPVFRTFRAHEASLVLQVVYQPEVARILLAPFEAFRLRLEPLDADEVDDGFGRHPLHAATDRLLPGDQLVLPGFNLLNEELFAPALNEGAELDTEPLVQVYLLLGPELFQLGLLCLVAVGPDLRQ